MKVKNRSCVRRLGFRQLKAAKIRNLIAILAIMLTTLLFTSIFTIAMSITTSYEEYNFRMAGGYCHGTFKEVNQEQWQAIANHPKIKETGARIVAGFCTESPFAKIPAEISWMDENCTKWSYATPEEGRMPQKGNEIAMDTASLRGLGVEPKLGEEITLSYRMSDVMQSEDDRGRRTDTFTLVGFWEYDTLIPVHYINVSREYVSQVEKEWTSQGGEPFRTDLNVMLSSSVNIEGVMQSVDQDLGYQWEDREAENCVRIGVNWGYVASEADSNIDFSMVATILAFACLVAFTGYLIIYNVFRISVTNDIRFYGMLKTIGATPRQLKRLVRYQALALGGVGIPLGLLCGYGIGGLLLPVVMGTTTMGSSVSKVSISPVIFAGAAAFSLLTILLSVARPGRLAAKVSPIEALRYTEHSGGRKKTRSTRGAKVCSMAFANMGRSRSKTALVVLSLSFAVVLFTMLCAFVDGFDLEKYVNRQLDADFLIAPAGYFRYEHDGWLSQETVDEITENTTCELGGSAYATESNLNSCWLTKELFRVSHMKFGTEAYESALQTANRRGELYEANLFLQGMDESLFSKLTVLEGDIAPLRDPDSHQIAVCVDVDDYGNPYGEYPRVGDTLPVTFTKSYRLYDSRTGEEADMDTPAEYITEEVETGNEVEYTVCAQVIRPYHMGFRYSTTGYEALLSTEQLKNDSGLGISRMFYMFDAPDDGAEAAAEAFLEKYTKGDELKYESKKLVREDFENFKNMFLLIGGMLCFIVAVVGVLNFLNAILTGIIVRRREFAMLQSVGMTGKQLKAMLIWEGLFYVAFSMALSLGLSLFMLPLGGKMMEGMFWFFTARSKLWPVFWALPVYVLLGILLPLFAYRFFAGKSIVERLRECDA